MIPRTLSVLALSWLAACGARDPEPRTNSLGMTLVPIPAGHFRMGQEGPPADYHCQRHPGKYDDADWDERPTHGATIRRPFYLGATEVTLGQYRQFRPEHRKDRGADDEAVTDVSWDEAMAFCAWLSQQEGVPYRLPTEAEWEYACRAGTTTLFHTGNALPDGFQKWPTLASRRDYYFPGGKLPPEFRAEHDPEAPLRVAQTPANAWGLFDMHGNVAEWCADAYGPYAAEAQTDPMGRTTAGFRVIRGGAHSMLVRMLRTANRGACRPGTRSDQIGFRVVQGPPPAGKPLPPPALPLNARDIDPHPADTAPASPEPFFSGPTPYVNIPPDSCGPLFSEHNHSPSLTECPNGDLLAVWFSCVEEMGLEFSIAASRLRRGAAVWEPASPFWDEPDVNEQAAKIWWDGARTLHFFACGLNENIVRTSTDNGATWSTARGIQPHGEFGNSLLRLGDGTLVLGHDSPRVSLVLSRDAGKTWTHRTADPRQCDFRPGGTGPRYPGIHAPMVQLADGRLLAMSRNDKAEDQARFGYKTPASFTADLGTTWTYAATEFPAISNTQRAAMIRLSEGPILYCSFTDQWRDWKNRRGLEFQGPGGNRFTGYGLFAALSFDDGATWPVRRLLTPGGPVRGAAGTDRLQFTLSDTMAEPCGYLAALQTRDGRIHLLSSKNHYVFNLAWLTRGTGEF